MVLSRKLSFASTYCRDWLSGSALVSCGRLKTQTILVQTHGAAVVRSGCGPRVGNGLRLPGSFASQNVYADAATTLRRIFTRAATLGPKRPKLYYPRGEAGALR